jgi:hypothetical protein
MQEKTRGDILAEDSASYETNKMTAAIQPIVLNNMIGGGGGSPCRFVAQPPAALPPVSAKNADSSIRNAFGRDKWA